ncbi:rhamnulokinase [Caldivirga sp.]|jgi:sugar (pentulose or hexulose) kinase|uniref:rhamnulokinase n=1 Tax=Caldivirga sp. TaxID=2080243 RepID=UPI003D0C6040
MDSVVMLAIDVGASGGKAIAGVLDLKELKLTIDELYRFPNQMIKVDNHLYWNVLQLWSEVKNSIKVALRKYKGKLTSVGIDTWGVDFALLDDHDELVGLPYAYRDPMTEGLMSEVFSKVPKEVIYSRTGIQFMRINTLYQLYALVKLNSPKLRIAKSMLMIPDLLNYWLSGVKVNEYTNASTTQFLDARSRKWCMDILEKLNIPTNILLEIVNAGSVLGNLRRDIVEELGEEAGKDISVIAPATHDTASAVAAGPMIDENTGYVSSGTWNLVGVELNEPLINEQAMLSNFTNEGGAFGTITFLRNMQGMWIIQEVRRIMMDLSGREYTYDELVNLAIKAEETGSFIDVDDPRFLAPINMINEIHGYLKETGQREPGSLGELIRLIISSIALKHRYIFEKATKITGRGLRRINIFGGGSRNNLMNQLTANVMGIPVYAGPEESTSIGNILIQASGMGIIKSIHELRSIVRNSFNIRVFEPKDEERYEDMYSMFITRLNLP